MKRPHFPATPSVGLLVAVATIPVFLSITKDQPHLRSSPIPACYHTHLFTHFSSAYQHALEFPIFIKGTKQNSLLWFCNYLQLPSHFSTPQQNSRELPTWVSQFLTGHSLLKPLWLGHSPIRSPRLPLPRV